MPDSLEGTIEGSGKLCQMGILAAKVLTCSEDNRVLLSLRNPSAQSISLHKGTHVGQFQTHSEGVQISNIDDHHELNEITAPHECENVNNVHVHKTVTENKPDVDKQNTDITDRYLEQNIDFEGSKLNGDEQKQLFEILRSHKNAFVGPDGRLGNTEVVTHKLKLKQPDERPFKARPYRTSPQQRNIMDRELSKLLEQGVIQPSDSPWCAPVVLVKKGDLSWRFCVDFRGLNAKCEGDSYPLPRIDDTLTSLGLSKPTYFSTFDLQSGFFQVSLDPKSRPLTAFSPYCGGGHYEFRKMAMGLGSSPATFQRHMETVLRGLSWKQCLIYLDDIIIFSSSLESHLRDISAVLARLENADLKLEPSKCKFAHSEIKFLGHVVGESGIQVNPDKVQTIKNYPVPNTLK